MRFGILGHTETQIDLLDLSNQTQLAGSLGRFHFAAENSLVASFISSSRKNSMALRIYCPFDPAWACDGGNKEYGTDKSESMYHPLAPEHMKRSTSGSRATEVVHQARSTVVAHG